TGVLTDAIRAEGGAPTGWVYGLLLRGYPRRDDAADPGRPRGRHRDGVVAPTGWAYGLLLRGYPRRRDDAADPRPPRGRHRDGRRVPPVAVGAPTSGRLLAAGQPLSAGKICRSTLRGALDLLGHLLHIHSPTQQRRQRQRHNQQPGQQITDTADRSPQ